MGLQPADCLGPSCKLSYPDTTRAGLVATLALVDYPTSAQFQISGKPALVRTAGSRNDRDRSPVHIRGPKLPRRQILATRGVDEVGPDRSRNTGATEDVPVQQIVRSVLRSMD